MVVAGAGAEEAAEVVAEVVAVVVAEVAAEVPHSTVALMSNGPWTRSPPRQCPRRHWSVEDRAVGAGDHDEQTREHSVT